MDDFVFARIIHVLAIVLWIGGVAFVTLVVMPMLNASKPPEARLAAFQQIEHGFSWQARLWVALSGASGLWLIWRGDMWDRFADVHYWWMHTMVLVWTIFALMLYVLEPLHLHKRMARSPTPAQDFAKMVTVHRALLILSLIAVLGAVGGSHGAF